MNNQYARNLAHHGNHCLANNPTHIYFLYFTINPVRAQVKRRFGRWMVNGEECYVIPNVQNNGVYVYRETGLRAVVRLSDPDADVGDVVLVGRGDDTQGAFEANIGSHIDYVPIMTRDVGPVMKTHLTEYNIYDD